MRSRQWTLSRLIHESCRSAPSRPRRKAFSWQFAIPGRALVRKIWSASSRRSTLRSPTEWGWGWRSAGPSLKRMGAGCGPKQTNFAGLYFGSLCPTPKTREFFPATEVTLSRKRAKSQTRGRKLRSTGAKARGARARKTRADLERQLKALRQQIAHARERLGDAAIQQTATSEMLRLISNSPIKSVLDAVAEHAARLCDASNARIWRLEDNLLRLVASYGESSVTMDGREGLPVNRDTVTRRAAYNRRTDRKST